MLDALALKADRRETALLAPAAGLDALTAVVSRKHDKDAFCVEKASLDEKIAVSSGPTFSSHLVYRYKLKNGLYVKNSAEYSVGLCDIA
jgi:hypothetical protein